MVLYFAPYMILLIWSFFELAFFGALISKLSRAFFEKTLKRLIFEIVGDLI